MADTNNLIKLQDMVDRYLFKYKKPTDDWALYFEHAADCARELNIHHLRAFKTQEATISSKGIITMPDDMIELMAVSAQWNGLLWSFTEEGLLDITAIEDGDADDIADDRVFDYGATGAKNIYYYHCDWDSRKIYLNGVPSETVILQYISSGLDLSTDTYLPAHAMFVVEKYLRMREADFDGLGINERQLREREYRDAIGMLRRVNMPSSAEFRDTLLSITTQTIIR